MNPTHCVASSWPTPTPTITPIPQQFQPFDQNGQRLACLAWRPFEPTGNPTPAPPWPTILVIHGGGFKQGAPFPHVLNETEDIINCANDLAAAGYYALVVAYRLAPPGLIPGQICQRGDDTSGFAPYQEYDVEAMIRAARADTDHVARVGVIGGSGGATHAIWAALDTRHDSSTDWPYWNSTRDDRPNAAVGLSGAYDFSDRTAEDYCLVNGGGDPVETFRKDIENYTRTNDPGVQYDRSVVCLVDQSCTTTFRANQVRPMQIYNTRHDNMPYHQIIDLQCALQNAGVSSSQYTITTLTHDVVNGLPGACERHAFGYWDAIKDQVISFFDCQLRGQCQ